jgi:hypothetical protein
MMGFPHHIKTTKGAVHEHYHDQTGQRQIVLSGDLNRRPASTDFKAASHNAGQIAPVLGP